MKKILLFAATVALAACTKPHPAATDASSVIEFSGTGLSLQPGPGWIRVSMKSLSKPLRQTIAEPALTNQGVTIQVALLGDRVTEDAVLAQVKAAFMADGQANRDSLEEGDFQAESGLHGKWFRYTRHAEHDAKRVINHLTQYIVRAGSKQWNSVGVMTDTVEHAKEVDAMIRRTLRDVPSASPTAPPAK